jgi:hypothetical protein
MEQELQSTVLKCKEACRCSLKRLELKLRWLRVTSKSIWQWWWMKSINHDMHHIILLIC